MLEKSCFDTEKVEGRCDLWLLNILVKVLVLPKVVYRILRFSPIILQ